MHIVDLSIKRPVTVAMGAAALVLFGILAYRNLPVSLLPETAVAVVSVQTVYGGASPLTIETQLTKKIEDQLFSIGELDSITSYSMDSVSIVTAAFKDGKDENLALQEVKDKIDAIAADLPSGAEKPIISKLNITAGDPVMNIILESGGGGGSMDATELYAYGSTVVADAIAQVTGVGNVEIAGGEKREIEVELHRAAVFERFLPVTEVAGLLARANMELPGGNVEFEEEDIPVRFKGDFTSLEAIENLDVPTRAGVFKLRQIADVHDSHTTVRERTVFFDKAGGKRNDGALLLRVMKNPSANTVGVVDGVMKRIPQIERESGGRVSLKVIREDAGFIRDSVSDTLGNLIMGIVLTGLVLLVFLHDWRSTLIISLAMPFSIIATFLVMQAAGISINVLSLMGLSSAVGTLVANSVVVLENIFRHKERGLSRMEAASVGTKEVIMAVIASTLTNVAVFVPLGGMAGAMGQILSHFAYTVVISTVFSIVASFTLTPLLASRLLAEKTTQTGRIGAAIDRFFKGLEGLYGKSVAVLLARKRRSAVFILAVFVVFILSIGAFSRIKMELVPKSDGGRIQLDVELPQGSSLDMTAVVLAEIERRLADYDEVRTILTNLGTAGSLDKDVSVARMEVALVPKAERSRDNSVIAAHMTRTLSDIPGATIRVIAPSELTIAQGAPIDLSLHGADSSVLLELGEQMRRKMQAVPGVTNAAINSKAGKRELVFEPRRKEISQDGLSVQAVALTLRAAIDGLVATTYREAGDEYDIRVKMSGATLTEIEDIRNIPVATSSGLYPLSRYAEVHFEKGYNMIMRVNKSRTVELTAELLPGYTQGPVLAEVMRAVGEIELPQGYAFGTAGLSDSMGEAMVSMAIVFITAILLVYMLLSAVLENLVQPLFILSTVPLSIIGVAAGCLLTNTVLNNIAMIGIVMLVGIVVNNAILILDYYNQLKATGLGVREALLEAATAKLKAILMSNIAIILGMIPMALGIGASLAEMRQPMGVIVIGGIISSTVMTLWLIPCLEFVLSRRKPMKHRKVLAVTALLICGAATFAEAGEYDLAAYLAKVETQNLDLAVAARETALAKTGVAQARAAFLPGVGLEGGYTRNLTDSLRSTPVASLPGGGPLVYRDVDSNYDNEVTVGIGLTQTLFDASAIANYQKALKGESIRQQSQEAQRVYILCAAKKLYMATMLTLRIVEIRDASETLSKEIYESTERKRRAGAATELDLLMAEVEWKSKAAGAREARKNAEITLVSFKSLAGIPLSEPVALTQEYTAIPELPPSPGLDKALASRADYRAQVLSRDLSDLDRKAALAAFLPTASASFSYALGGMGNNGSLTGDYDFNSAALSLNVRIPLFTGGYRLARVKEAELEQEKAALSLLKKQNAIEGELTEVRLRLIEAKERTESAFFLQETAQRALALSQTSFANGLITQLVLTEAVNKVDEARIGFENAVYEYFAAYYDWEVATGGAQ